MHSKLPRDKLENTGQVKSRHTDPMRGVVT